MHKRNRQTDRSIERLKFNNLFLLSVLLGLFGRKRTSHHRSAGRVFHTQQAFIHKSERMSSAIHVSDVVHSLAPQTCFPRVLHIKLSLDIWPAAVYVAQPQHEGICMFSFPLFRSMQRDDQISI
jgi:hypothetical protein